MDDSANISNQFWLDDRLSEQQKGYLRQKEQVERAKRLEKRNKKEQGFSGDSEDEVFFNVRSELESEVETQNHSRDRDGANAQSNPRERVALTSERERIETGQEYFMPDISEPSDLEKRDVPIVRPKIGTKVQEDLREVEEKDIFGESTGSAHGRYDGYFPSLDTIRKSVDEIDKFKKMNMAIFIPSTDDDDTKPSRGIISESDMSRKSDIESEKRVHKTPKKTTIKMTPEIMDKIHSLENDRRLEGSSRKKYVTNASEEQKSQEISTILRQQAEVNKYKAYLAEEKKKNDRLRQEYKKEMRKQRLENRRRISSLTQARNLLNMYKSPPSETSHNEMTTDVQSDWTEVTDDRTDRESVISQSRYRSQTQTESETDGVSQIKSPERVVSDTDGTSVQDPRVPIIPLQNNLGALRYSRPIRKALLTRTLNEDNPIVQGQRQKLDERKKQRYREMYPSLFINDDQPIPPSRGGGDDGDDGGRRDRKDDKGNKDSKRSRGGGSGPPDSPSSSSESGRSSRSSGRKRRLRKHKGKGDSKDEWYIPNDYRRKFPYKINKVNRDEYEMFKRQFAILKMCHGWNKGCERYELLAATEGLAAKRVNVLSDEETKNIDNVWRVLDNAFLPAHYRRTIMAEFHALKKAPSDSMKTYYLDLVESYKSANKGADDVTIREAVREVMLQNMDEEDYDVIRPYLHLDDPEIIANNYDSIILQLQRNNRSARKESELETVNRIRESPRRVDTKVQTPEEMSAVNINVVQPAGDKEKGTKTHLMTKPDSGQVPVIMMSGPPMGLSNSDGNAGSTVPTNVATNQAPMNTGPFPNGLIPQPAYAPLNAYSVAPSPIIIQTQDRSSAESDGNGNGRNGRGNYRGRNNYRGRGGYRGGRGRNYRGNGRNYNNDNYNNRDNNNGYSRNNGERRDQGNQENGQRDGQKQVRFEDQNRRDSGYKGNRNRRDNSNFQCYNCGEWGHKAYECDKKKDWNDGGNKKGEEENDLRTMIKDIRDSQQKTREDVDRLCNAGLNPSGLSQMRGMTGQTGILRR